MSYLFEIGSRRRKTSRLIGMVRDELVRAFVHEKVKSNISQDDLANKLDVHKSVVSRDLNSGVNMSLSKIADYAWAMDLDIVFKLKQKNENTYEASYDGEQSAIAPHLAVLDDIEQLEDA
ncbi:MULTISPECIES: hypothetical protein [Methylobacterium]|uniref:hypothetical protein n=1 Tax=Methylobacterium TaxID=407 RepID=UPI0013EC8A1C|nr:hypothetical protein [Methylobacterium sp. DB0501]NGM39039.1 hypothetical protein [Methylobacterium sp. DB0501]